MLTDLVIRDYLLIDRLEMAFGAGLTGLTVLTGETGAGKSILLDALGRVLGQRGGGEAVRPGAEQASIAAEFTLPAGHPAFEILAEQDIVADTDAPERLLLRRVLRADGRSRAYVNDQPASVGLLRRLGARLIEIHGQFDTQGLLDPASHGTCLDAHGKLAAPLAAVARAWQDWRDRRAARDAAAQDIARAAREEEFLRHARAELDALDPQAGEEPHLVAQRGTLMNRETLIEAMNAAMAELAGERGAEPAISRALAGLERAAARLEEVGAAAIEGAGEAGGPGQGGPLAEAISALDRGAAEIQEAISALQAAGSEIEQDTGSLETIEQRLFDLRAAARKHGVEVVELPGLRRDFARRLELIGDRTDLLARLDGELEAAREGYIAAAQALTEARRTAAARLDRAVARELPPLKLDKARFVTEVTPLAESRWGPGGQDRVRFLVATNPGAEPGPLDRIASGGELARFMLALKLNLTETSPAGTLIFDEIDTGVGGAVAEAVGARLARLGESAQVMVVTHAPQIAARAQSHWQVAKQVTEQGGEAATRTELTALAGTARREEIARMLSGAVITDAARDQADQLMQHPGDGRLPTQG